MSEHTDRANPKPPSVDRLSQLWRRINDHKMVQWSVAYVAIAYGLQHGVVLTGEAFDWPHVVSRISMLLLVLGLPVVMTLAWYHGARASRRISGPELFIISILLVIGTFLFYTFAQPSEQLARSEAPTQQANLSPAAPSPPQTDGVSLAVLPFANLSGDASQDYFSDGMTEEIMAALAKVPTLRVVGRESAFQFKGQKIDNRDLGKALGASYLIEGSVRKAGDRVRITAQLVETMRGGSLWTESYDRELKDIFATQEGVAQAITHALPLGLQQGKTLFASRTKDEAVYEDYLRAKGLVRTRGLEPITRAISILENVVARDPGYADAWALLAYSYGRLPNNSRETRGGPVEEGRKLVEELKEKAEKAAREAIQLDAQNALAYAALAVVRGRDGKWTEAEDLYNKAIALDPGEPDAIGSYATMLGDVGRFRDALKWSGRARTLEPFVPGYAIQNAFFMKQTGETAAAIAVLEALPPTVAGGYGRNADLAELYAEEGHYDKAADTLLLITGNVVSQQSVQDAARLLRKAPAKLAPASLPDLDAGLTFVYGFIGAYELGLKNSAERALAMGLNVGAGGAAWYPAFGPLRKTERFRNFVRRAGLVDFWKARGWPDLCHPVGADDFVCE